MATNKYTGDPNYYLGDPNDIAGLNVDDGSGTILPMNVPPRQSFSRTSYDTAANSPTISGLGTASELAPTIVNAGTGIAKALTPATSAIETGVMAAGASAGPIKAAGTTLKAAAVGSAFIPVVGPILSAIFTGADMLLGWADRKSAQKKADQQYKDELAREAAVAAKGERLYNQKLAKEQEQTNYDRAQGNKGWDWKQEDKNFTRAMGVFDHITLSSALKQKNLTNDVNLFARR